MAFLPEKNFLEETIISGYSLSNGVTAFTSSDVSRYTTISLQFVYNNINGNTEFCLEQSNDNINWGLLSENYSIPIGSGNFTIDKGMFTGKHVRVNLKTSGVGNLTIKLLAKR
jgi:hypothetical protein